MVETLYYIVIIATFIFFFLTFFIVYLAVVQNRKKAFFRQEVLRIQMEIKDQTLQHIAYELHDNLGQIASLIKINLNTIQLHEHEKATEKLESTKTLIRQLLTDIKNLSLSLNSDRAISLGIVTSLATEIDKLNKLGQAQYNFLHEGSTPSLNANTTLFLYRMAQEIISNIMKHSNASRVDVRVHVTEKLFTLVISDDGVGFNHDEKIRSGGSGLVNLQNRAKLINGQLLIESLPGRGTKISIEVPV